MQALGKLGGTLGGAAAVKVHGQKAQRKAVAKAATGGSGEQVLWYTGNEEHWNRLCMSTCNLEGKGRKAQKKAADKARTDNSGETVPPYDGNELLWNRIGVQKSWRTVGAWCARLLGFTYGDDESLWDTVSSYYVSQKGHASQTAGTAGRASWCHDTYDEMVRVFSTKIMETYTDSQAVKSFLLPQPTTEKVCNILTALRDNAGTGVLDNYNNTIVTTMPLVVWESAMSSSVTTWSHRLNRIERHIN